MCAPPPLPLATAHPPSSPLPCNADAPGGLQDGRVALEVAKTMEIKELLSARAAGEAGKAVFDSVMKGDIERLRGLLGKGTPTNWKDEARGRFLSFASCQEGCFAVLFSASAITRVYVSVFPSPCPP